MKASLWHESKSPLTAARLGIQLLRTELEEKGKLDSETQEIISQIEERINLSIQKISELQKKFEPNN